MNSGEEEAPPAATLMAEIAGSALADKGELLPAFRAETAPRSKVFDPNCGAGRVVGR